VSAVVEAAERARLARPVARLETLVCVKVSSLSDLEIKMRFLSRPPVDLTALIDFITAARHPLPNFEEQAGVNKATLCRLSRSDHDAFKIRN
jgi:hypothetical protein